MNRSLNNVMNKMARCESILSTMAPYRTASLECLSELDAFVILDDTLNFLHKQYLEAKTQRKELVALNGADDAMVDVALDMEDSAWCAMQTRYIELRAQRKMMAQAQQMMRVRERQIEELNEKIEQSHKQKKAQDFVNYLKAMEVMKQKNKTPRIFEWLVLFLIFRDNFINRSLNQQFQNFSMAL